MRGGHPTSWVPAILLWAVAAVGCSSSARPGRPGEADGAAGGAGGNVAADAGAGLDLGGADTPAPMARISVLTQRYGNARLGWNDQESILTPQAVGSGRFGRLFVRKVKGQIYTQPLVVADLDLPGKGKRDVVVVATESNKVYAFDAADPAAGEPLWLADFGTSVPFLAMEASDFATRGYCACPDISPELGITATPVIDRTRGALYVVSKHITVDGGFSLLLHALDIKTGKEMAGSPVKIEATAPGTGDGSVGGMIRFDPQRHNVRAALLLSKGRIYLGFTSHGDTPPYHGWVMTYDAATLAQTGVFLTTPAGGGGAIWMAGGGLAADDDGNVYFSTGNGTVGGDPARPDLAHSLVKLATAGGKLQLADWFTGAQWMAWNGVDQDFGSSAVLLLPAMAAVLTAGKSGPAYLLDRTNLGKLSANDGQVLQRLQPPAPNQMMQQHGGFAYWEGPAGPTVFTWPSSPTRLLGIKLVAGRLESTPSLVGPLPSLGKPGGSLSVSSNGKRDGVVWTYAYDVALFDSTPSALPGVIRAYDAGDFRPLWDSSANRERDAPGNYAKFMIPTVANGKVYISTFSDQLVVYGLLPGVDAPPDAGAPPDGPAATRCGPPPSPDRPYGKLSQTACLDPRDPTRPLLGLVPYTVNSPLWSDGAAKERLLALPEGKRIHVKSCVYDPTPCRPVAMGGSPHDEGHFELPVGTVLVKTFLIAGRRVETRLLVHFADRWAGYSYAWNDDQTEATVIPAPDGAVSKDFPNPALPGGTQTWTYPSRQDCNTCHIQAAGFQLGLELSQLNRTVTFPDGTQGNQLDLWESKSMFDAALLRPLRAALPNPTGTRGTVEQRARSYLHANCAICHRPGSNFPGLDLRFATPLAQAAACDVDPIKGDLGVAGAKILSPGSPDSSTITLRMRVRGEGQMPQLATRYVDEASAAVIADWIRSVTACP